ncbi:MAG: endolytic transglycosylase MltG [Gammaproteobacteria bacterium]|nr:endolytic transglycosylase MltG [Gammaproteobacteria bacterium]MCI0590317.1 endolytic transglycosylase MltG [Gammaproteobacteria bacterium]
MPEARRALITLVAISVLLAGFFGIWFWVDVHRAVMAPIVLNAPTIRYAIKPGRTLRTIAYELADLDVLKHPAYLVLVGRLQGNAGKIKSGEYEFEMGMTPLEILDMFVKGKVVQYALTLVEGWTFFEVLRAVNNDEHLIHLLNGLDDEAVMTKLGEPGVHPEGRFFPDTYYFPSATTDVDFLKRARRKMDEVLSREWAARDLDLPYESSYEALIMASIIEKEASRPEERAAISGVFVRRLQRGMNLQTDPTVIYALGAEFDGNIKRPDLDVDNPYNTYRYKGLTPTPIAMPGADSIYAALHPAAGESLYFVSRGDGTHHFSKSLAEHRKAVAKYQLKSTTVTCQ